MANKPVKELIVTNGNQGIKILAWDNVNDGRVARAYKIYRITKGARGWKQSEWFTVYSFVLIGQAMLKLLTLGDDCMERINYGKTTEKIIRERVKDNEELEDVVGEPVSQGISC